MAAAPNRRAQSLYRLAIRSHAPADASNDGTALLCPFYGIVSDRAKSSSYKIEELPNTDWEFFEMAGRNRGCVRAGNQVDTYRMSEILINELRSGKLGRITLETPEMTESEELVVAEQRLAAEEKRIAKEEKRLRRLKTRKNRK